MKRVYEQEIDEFMAARGIGYSELGRQIGRSRKTVFSWVTRMSEDRAVIVVAEKRGHKIVEIYARNTLYAAGDNE